MEKTTKDIIKASIPIVIGLVVLLLQRFLAGLILILTGLGIAWMNENLRNWILSAFKSLIKKEGDNEKTINISKSNQRGNRNVAVDVAGNGNKIVVHSTSKSHNKKSNSKNKKK